MNDKSESHLYIYLSADFNKTLQKSTPEDMVQSTFNFSRNINGVKIGCYGRYIDGWMEYAVKYYVSDKQGYRVIKPHYTNIKLYPDNG
jgi:hypothetical protein